MQSNRRMDCHRCGGRNTLSISVDGGKEKAQCFKAGCSLAYTKILESDADYLSSIFKGRHAIDWVMDESRTLDDYTFVNISSNADAYKYVDRYRLDHVRDMLSYDPARHRLVFTYRDQAVGRHLSGGVPKWYRYTDSEEPIVFETSEWISDKNPLVIVEDCVSAARISKHVNSMALLGTEFVDNYYKYLSDFKQVFIALDKDATNKSIDMARNLCYVRDTKVAMIEADLKDYDDEDLIHWFNDWEIDYVGK